MTLRTLRVETMRSETTFLQPLFDDWKNRAARGIAVAGAPDWLLDIQVQNAKDRSFEAYGYSFEIDVLWRLENERRVLELKNAAKYEPLALAEVLHHAYLLRECEPDEREIKSTIIARYHPWMRAALKELQRAGLAREQPEYLEFDHLWDGSQQVLWIDSPLSTWVARSLPADFPEEVRAGFSHWYWVEHTNSWVGTDTELPADRPPFMTAPFTMVAHVEGRADDLLVWRGSPPARGLARGHDWNEAFMRYCA